MRVYDIYGSRTKYSACLALLVKHGVWLVYEPWPGETHSTKAVYAQGTSTWCRVCILVSGRVTRTTYGAYYSFRATQLLRRMFLTVLNIGDHDVDVLPLSKSFKPRKYDRTRWVMKKQRNLSPVFPCAWTNRTRSNGPCQRSSLRERNLAQVILQATADCGSGSLPAARLQAVRSLYHFERTVKL